MVMWYRMSTTGVKALLTTGRTLKQGRGMEIGKLSEDYFQAVAICEMDKTTLETLGLQEGDPVLLGRQGNADRALLPHHCRDASSWPTDPSRRP